MPRFRMPEAGSVNQPMPARTALPPGSGDAGLKVLHVIPSVADSSGGPSKAIVQMERILTASGVTVVTATTDDGGEGGPRARVPVTGIACNGALRYHFPLQARAYKTSLPLAGWLQREVRRFDVVHVHALFSFAPVVAAWIARDASVPYVIRPLGVLNRYGMTERRSRLKSMSLKLIEARLLRDAAAVHFTSEQERDEAESLGIRMRTRVVPLGVEPVPAATPDALLERYPALRGKRRLLYLSRIDPKKNLEALLQALATTRVMLPDVALVICGTGDAGYTERLQTMASRLAIEDCVVWAGHLEGGLKASAFAAADLFVLPSFSENFGIAPVEALSAGVPCVLGRGVAVAARVDEVGAGRMVSPSAEAVADAIGQCLSDGTWLRRAGAQARSLAATDYSVEAMGRGLLAMYADARTTRWSGT